MVLRPYLGKCDSADPTTGTSINKWRVHVCVGVSGIILPAVHGVLQTLRGQGQTRGYLQKKKKNCYKGLTCQAEFQLAA